MIEFLWPHGGGSPLHVHHNEDEWFYVIEGEVTFWVGGETIVAPAGSFVYGPRDVPHTFVITLGRGPLPDGHRPGPVRRLRPRRLRAGRGAHAAAGVCPAARRPEELTAIAAEYGIEILGPPGIPA